MTPRSPGLRAFSVRGARLVRQTVDRDSSTFVNPAKERPGITATSNKPVLQGVGRTVGGISRRSLRPFQSPSIQGPALFICLLITKSFYILVHVCPTILSDRGSGGRGFESLRPPHSLRI